MKRLNLTILLPALLFSAAASGQLTADECYARARANYPLIQQYGLIGESERYDLRNASTAYLPQFQLSAKATWQTDVTSIDVALPPQLGDIAFPEVRKDQYQAVVELSQTIWDGGQTGYRRETVKTRSEAERAELEVNLYTLRERVDNLFFGILLLDRRLELIDNFDADLRRSYDRVSAAVDNGAASRADVYAIEAEQLTVRQNRAALEAALDAYLAMLSALVGEPLNDPAMLAAPDAAALAAQAAGAQGWDNRRPELALFDAQSARLGVQRKGVNALIMPRIGLFVQGGYGNPGLNMLKDEFVPFAIGGVRLSWAFGGLYTRRNDLRNIDAGRRGIEVQREAFLFNNGLEFTRQRAELEKYRRIMDDDDRIIDLRRRIREASEAKVENGTLGAADLLRDMNAEQNARLNKAIHETEMMQTICQMKNLKNN